MLVCKIDNKYTVIQDKNGKLYALRYGEQWRECVGDNLILRLAQEVVSLREIINNAKDVLNKNTYD